MKLAAARRGHSTVSLGIVGRLFLRGLSWSEVNDASQGRAIE